MTPLLDLLDEIVRDVVEVHDVEETELRASVAEKIAVGLRVRGFDSDPDIEAVAASRWPVN